MFKRAAIVTGLLTATFAGAGTALVITQPDDSFAMGIGIGHLLWSPALAAQTILDIVMMKRARSSTRRMRLAEGPLWSLIVNVAASSALTAGGLGATIAGLAMDGNADIAGVGTVFATYGAVLLALSTWDLVRAKRRRRKCRETCPAPRLSGAFAMRF